MRVKFQLSFSVLVPTFQTHSVFGGQLDMPPNVTSCPLGAEGLACRQAEARRVIENCPGGKVAVNSRSYIFYDVTG
jgi:hypothetical protein